jgi:hypothetical protein
MTQGRVHNVESIAFLADAEKIEMIVSSEEEILKHYPMVQKMRPSDLEVVQYE